MANLINKDALVAEIEKRKNMFYDMSKGCEDASSAKAGFYAQAQTLEGILSFLDTLEVKGVGVWKTVDDINPPQADRNKIYCVFTKQRYILAKVIDHPQDDGLLQWKCTEFPNHRYDMCEGDKYMQIV